MVDHVNTVSVKSSRFLKTFFENFLKRYMQTAGDI